MNPFEYVKSITHSKVDIMTGEEEEKGYNSFLINRGLSYYQDTVLFANEMNEYYGYSNQKAESVIDLLTDDDIKNMKSYLSKGGSKKNAK